MVIYKEYQPLRVSSDWKFEWNCFFEIDPTESNMSYFTEKLLYLISESRKRSIELLWKPEDDPKGEYVLRVINLQEEYNNSLKRVDLIGDWGNLHFVFKSRNRFEIVDKIEELMYFLEEYKDPRIFKSKGVVNEELDLLRIDLEKEGYTKLVAEKICLSNNETLQDLLIDSNDISKENLLFLKEKGAKKGIKNKANQKLNSKKYK